jgi:hypothetical protein
LVFSFWRRGRRGLFFHHLSAKRGHPRGDL